MKTLKTNPGAKRLMESLRNMGYDCSTAIADLVDNSVAAHASEIYIDIIPEQDSHPAAIIIADNGKGMDRNQLHEAMRFGTFQEYSPGDLGKYGLGLKTASLSQCRTMTVTSKAKPSQGMRPKRHCMRWDIDHVYETDDWNLMELSEREFEFWEQKLLNNETAEENGTVVLWTNLDEALPLLSSENRLDRERFLAHLIDETGSHLRMVFHRFMQGAVTGRRKLNIFLCGEQLVPWDPFCRDEKTKELDILRIPVISMEPDGSKLKDTVTVSPFVLPRDDEFSSPVAWREASGPKNWNQQQGFYFYRNNRLLQSGGWNRIRTVDEHTKLLRVAVDFPDELDRAFSINITKMRAKIPAEIREKISSHVSGWAKVARARYDGISSRKNGHNPKQKTTLSPVNKPVREESVQDLTIGRIFLKKSNSGKNLVITEDRNRELINVTVPVDHELSGIFSNGNSWNHQKFSMLVMSLLEAVANKKISVDRIPVKSLKKIYKEHL